MIADQSPPTLPSSFEWKPSFLAQLRHIADTDEFSHDDDHHPSSALPSSSSAPTAAAAVGEGLGNYDWPQLKDAIKYRIRVCLEQEFSGERGMVLHPAAKLIPFMGEGVEFADVVRMSASLSADEKEDEEEMKMETADSSETESQSNGQIRPPYIPPAETQNFYPSKRSLPPSTSTSTAIPLLTPSELASTLHQLYGMLEDFDLQPPFTIQRLSELLVSPTTHYRNPRKWIRAVERCLSVTATRDAFPISPVQGPIGVGANGIHAAEGENGEGEGIGGEMSEIEMDRMDGLPPTSSAFSLGGRSRSSSIASTSEPLFSPIPFIVRDENGDLTHPGTNAQVGEDGGERGGLGLTEAIPDLELGGADRTRQVNETPRELVDVAPSAPTPNSGAMGEMDKEAAQEEEKEGEGEDIKMNDSFAPASASATAETSIADAAGSVAAAVDATQPPTPATASTDTITTTTAAATAGAATPEPLGIPNGEVDELDNPSQSVHPLTSTTAVPNLTSEGEDPSITASSTVEKEKNEEKEGKSEETEKKEDDKVEQGEEEGRSSKRRKSVASITDSRD